MSTHNKLAFSRPTDNDVERHLLFTSFRASGYRGLQLKYGQYSEYLDHPARFIEQWGTNAIADAATMSDMGGRGQGRAIAPTISDIASGLIMGGLLDEAGIEELRRVLRFAQVVGSERIIFCHAQPRQGLTSSDIKGFARVLSDLGKEAQQEYGVILSLHHHYNQPVMHRQDFAIFFDAVDEGTVRLTVDTAHLVKSGIDDIAGVIREYRHVLDNMHMKDFADGDFKVLGQGNIDFAPVFSVLHEIGYAGWLCADEESGGNLQAGMEMCAQFIRKMTPEASHRGQGGIQ
jgi:inosose dehydratase